MLQYNEIFPSSKLNNHHLALGRRKLENKNLDIYQITKVPLKVMKMFKKEKLTQA